VPDRDKLALLHKDLAEQVEALRAGDQWRRMLDFASRMHTYSLSNILLIQAQWDARLHRGDVTDPSPGQVAGYHTWRTLGRNVIHGQKGLAIIAPTIYQDRFAEQSDATIRRLGKGERPHLGEELLRGDRTVRGFKIEYVFALSQTDGAPLPTAPEPQQLTGAAPDGLIDGLIGYAQRRDYRVERTASAADLGGADGRTDFAARTITVRSDMDDAAIATTLAHEIGHVMLHDPERDGARIAHRGIGEVEAESVAYLLAAAHGLDTSADSLPYVAGWLATTQEPTDTISATANRVIHAAHQVLSALDTVQFGDGGPPGLDHAHAHRATDLDETPPVDLLRGIEPRR
jgi:hypothetical protein